MCSQTNVLLFISSVFDDALVKGMDDTDSVELSTRAMENLVDCVTMETNNLVNIVIGDITMLKIVVILNNISAQLIA